MPWADHPNVKAILAAHLPGEESGNSLVDVLWGDVEPSGRLPYTIPKSASDYDIPVTNLTGRDVGRYGWQANFTEGLMIDYRHFDSLDIQPLYEFGYGLGYTTFELAGDLSVTKASPDATISEIPDRARGVEPGCPVALILDLGVVVANGRSLKRHRYTHDMRKLRKDGREERGVREMEQ